MTKLYEDRDIDALRHYMNHVAAMTTENLYSKAAIAAELAYRDERIEELQEGVNLAIKALNSIVYSDLHGLEPNKVVAYQTLNKLVGIQK